MWKPLIDRLEANEARQAEQLEATRAQLKGAREAQARQAELPLGVPSAGAPKGSTVGSK